MAKISAMIQQADLLKKKDPQKALGLVNEVLRADSRHPSALGIKTECLINLKRFGEALKCAKRNVQISGNEVSYGLLYLTLTHLGKFSEALEAAERSASLAPGSEISRQQLRRAILQNRLQKMVENGSLETTSINTADALHDSAHKKMCAKKFDEALEDILEACEISGTTERHRQLLQEILRLKEKARKKK